MMGRIVNKGVPLKVDAFSTAKIELRHIAVDPEKMKAYIKVDFCKDFSGREKWGQFYIEYTPISCQIAKVGKDYVLLKAEKVKL